MAVSPSCIYPTPAHGWLTWLVPSCSHSHQIPLIQTPSASSLLQLESRSFLSCISAVMGSKRFFHGEGTGKRTAVEGDFRVGKGRGWIVTTERPGNVGDTRMPRSQGSYNLREQKRGAGHRDQPISRVTWRITRRLGSSAFVVPSREPYCQFLIVLPRGPLISDWEQYAYIP